MNLQDNINIIKGVGPSREKELNSLGVFTVEDLLYFFPKSYKSRETVKKIDDLQVGDIIAIVGVVVGKNTFTRGTRTITKIVIKDDTEKIEAIFFNQPYLYNSILYDTSYMFSGKVVEVNGELILSNPEYEKEKDVKDDILPLYKFSSQKILRKIMKNLLEEIQLSNLEEHSYIPDFILYDLNINSSRKSFSDIHFPKNIKCLELAQKYFSIEELFVLQLALSALRKNIKKDSPVIIKETNVTDIINLLEFKLTKSQEHVIEEIKNDMQTGKVMYRLLQGDVGSGKTIVAAIAAYIAVKNGYQVAVMVPTSILASQHAESFFQILEPLGIKVELLTSTIKGKNRILDRILVGRTQVIIATHAAISESTIFNNLGLVITDEQHRFGVGQREALEQKGDLPHVLIMSATPIPRSLALILYGDLDISTIEQLPEGRQAIETYTVKTSYRHRIWNFIEDQADKNNQSYIVCPAIDSESITSVYAYVEELSNFYKSKNSLISKKIAIIHGKLKDDEKAYIMNQFKTGEKMILVATTVVEVGINLPTATVMVIEEAHRFGLSQLHQLRGRVGRSSLKSYCVLVSDTNNKLSKARLKAMVDNNDGFSLSSMDLELRGPGDFFGFAQSGFFNLNFSNLDINIIKEFQKYTDNLDFSKYPKLFRKVSNFLKS